MPSLGATASRWGCLSTSDHGTHEAKRTVTCACRRPNRCHFRRKHQDHCTTKYLDRFRAVIQMSDHGLPVATNPWNSPIIDSVPGPRRRKTCTAVPPRFWSILPHPLVHLQTHLTLLKDSISFLQVCALCWTHCLETLHLCGSR
jgi:hypothetical protein